jgi:hypothetical protein
LFFSSFLLKYFFVRIPFQKLQYDCGIKVTYALSPQAKGKIERPYGWIQDRLVRACYRKRISDINQAQLVLNSLIQEYNHQWIHSTTGEIPYIY